MIIEIDHKTILNHEVVILSCHAFGILTPLILIVYNPIMPSALINLTFLAIDSRYFQSA